ncbi:MAG TPA: HAMP domain-containing sensor histidine kinase [Flavisolibacter sp.]|jgi:signal transduction histidine kinase|nr:HAMP domain-containing sensor histidine kinase [Flavisolibacter sp.]
MKLLNYTTTYLAGLLLVIITIWAAIFYYAMLDEIYDSIDDGLDNQKGLIIQKITVDSSILRQGDFNEGGFLIREISAAKALNFYDQYIDTTMYMQNEREYEPVRLLRTVFEHQGRYYQMSVYTSMVEEDDLVMELLYALLWLYFGLLATILLLNNFLLKRIWKPFYRLIKQLKTFRLEKPSIQVSPTRIEEFRLLNDAVQRLLQSNIASYNSQKHFIENASHELQTPLAISINKLEALAETGDLNEEQSRLLAAALDNLERLTRLNRSLLLLSRIENRQFTATEAVNLNALVKKIAGDFEDQFAFGEVSFLLREEATVTVQMNADLGAILITNLLKNALVHNRPGGSVEVMLQNNALQVSNTGNEMPLQPESLFSRFQKQSTAGTSTGLGLSIVKAIADLYGFTVSYDFKSRHYFRVQFAS